MDVGCSCVKVIHKFDCTGKAVAIWHSIFAVGAVDGKIAVWDMLYSPLSHKKRSLGMDTAVRMNEDQVRACRSAMFGGVDVELLCHLRIGT